MIVRRKLTVLDFAQYFGLAIEYDSTLPAGIQGCLEPGDDPRFVLINPAQPDFEQRFTIAHEIAHHVLHHNQPGQHQHHWFLTRQWQWRPLAQISRSLRLAKVIILNKEWQADLWAICLLIQIGDMDTLTPYLSRHPKKKIWFFIALLVSIFRAIPRLPRFWGKRFVNLIRSS